MFAQDSNQIGQSVAFQLRANSDDLRPSQRTSFADQTHFTALICEEDNLLYQGERNLIDQTLMMINSVSDGEETKTTMEHR